MNLNDLIQLGSASITLTQDKSGKFNLALFSEGKPTYGRTFLPTTEEIQVVDQELTVHCFMNKDPEVSITSSTSQKSGSTAVTVSDTNDSLMNEFGI